MANPLLKPKKKSIPNIKNGKLDFLEAYGGLLGLLKAHWRTPIHSTGLKSTINDIELLISLRPNHIVTRTIKGMHFVENIFLNL